MDEIDSASRDVDLLVVKAERLIELATERRAAILTAAVTGHIDVRERKQSTTSV